MRAIKIHVGRLTGIWQPISALQPLVVEMMQPRVLYQACAGPISLMPDANNVLQGYQRGHC